MTAINQTGVFLGKKHAVQLMRQNGAGSIVNICSIWGVSGVGDYLVTGTEIAVDGGYLAQ